MVRHWTLAWSCLWYRMYWHQHPLQCQALSVADNASHLSTYMQPIACHALQEPENKHEVPRVSPYRLAAHLTSAFAIYATLVWTTLDLARPSPLLSSVAASAKEATHAALSAAAKHQAAAAAALRARVLLLSLLVGVTAISGAFVAGLDAGRAYNTFPLMDGQLIPEEYWGLPGIRNAFENTAAVQLHHRALAISTLAAVTTVWATARKMCLPRPARLALNATALLTAAQVSGHMCGAASRSTFPLGPVLSSITDFSSVWHACRAVSVCLFVCFTSQPPLLYPLYAEASTTHPVALFVCPCFMTASGHPGHHNAADLRPSVPRRCTPKWRPCPVHRSDGFAAQLAASQPLCCGSGSEPNGSSCSCPGNRSHCHCCDADGVNQSCYVA